MTLEKNLEFIRPGSAKDIYRVDADTIAFRFNDYFSVFDVGRAPYPIPGKGKVVCACAVKSFEIAAAIGVPTHFVERLDDVTIRVREAGIIVSRFLTSADENYVVPAEFIYRLFVAGSIDRDFRSGKKKPENYGLPSGEIPATGTPFPYPVHMFTTKFEDVDRDMTVEEMCHIAGITLKDQYDYWAMIDRLTGAIGLTLAQCGFALVDGKMECLMGPGREKYIGDVFGTPDEDRFCPLQKLREGEVIHYSKEFLRQTFIKMGYLAEIQAARNAGQPDPPYPQLPDNVIEEASRRYTALAKAYTQNDKLSFANPRTGANLDNY